MEKEKIIKRVMEKREFTKLPKKDVEMALRHFEKRQVSDEEKARLTRELLHKVYGGFVSRKLLSPKDKHEEWVLRKHLSTRERLPYYKEVYDRIFEKLKPSTIIDLGAGVNGFSYNYFPYKVNYVGVEAIAQLVELTSNYFKKNKIPGKMYHFSLFDINGVKEIIKKTKKPRIILLLKMIGPLEAMQRDYSKELLEQIAPLADRVIISFATETMQKRLRFKWNRKWLLDFIKKRFKLLDDFELGGERYLVFK